MKEKLFPFFKKRRERKRKEALDKKVKRHFALFSHQIHKQVMREMAELRQDRLDQERATGEGMPEQKKG